ncbi:MAG: DNA mismatch repair protein MutS [Acetobacteraceae bacterium]|nr:DNA mismatch repair protein MutS [Acetobacteraceae bacterium]
MHDRPLKSSATPAMAQWFAMKEQHPDALLLFRMGDFFELFMADAEAAAAALDIQLTTRGEHAGVPIPMCGVPVHAVESYLARLIRRGFRVAIAEQMEDPKNRAGKGPIRREVVRLLTPGTLTEESLLEAGRVNLLAAFAQCGEALGAAWIDISTGLFETSALTLAELPALLARLDPAEILAGPEIPLADWSTKRGPDCPAPTLGTAQRWLAEAFGVASLDAFGTFSEAEACAAALALDYTRRTQAGNLPRLSRPAPQGQAGVLAMDAATRSSLEITRARDGSSRHTLLSAVQRTVTAAGARLLAARIAAPLTCPAQIGARQDAWAWLIAHPERMAALAPVLKSAPDLARALARLSLRRGSPRDLAGVRDSLTTAGRLAHMLAGPLPAELAACRQGLQVDPGLAETLSAALADPAPVRLEAGETIRPGFDPELDAERCLRDDSRRVIAGLQLDYAQRFGVASLKIRHHAQLGYVIEVPAASAESLRAQAELSLRQSMASGARFSTAELADLDRRITEAAERAASRERAVFSYLVAQVLDRAESLARCADALAALDVAQSAAALAQGGEWCRPVVEEGEAFLIKAGRHPVVEAALAGAARFVANDCDLSPERRVLLLTGPNMAGKSTFLRQNALIAILAQAGLPVPAASARIGVVDRLFSRVGAADDLARGRSTFMVEMTETAAILHGAGPRSLVVVDEIGRGTATLDGLAIAWAVLEALHSAIRCRTIFATHFHELAGLGEYLPRVVPHRMRVKSWQGSVVFLHEVAEGAGSRSWGVHVAALAGVPAPVVRRASTLLAALEKHGGPHPAIGLPPKKLPLFASAEEEKPAQTADPVHEALAAIEPDRLTPREALDTLYRIKALLAVASTEKALI